MTQPTVHKVLFCCMGNICRSPTAEGVFRDLLKEYGVAAEVDSAGTHDYHVGRPPDPRSRATAARHGVDISGLRARQVAPQDLRRFDWVLAMDSDNLAHLEQMHAAHGGPARIARLLDFAGGGDVPDPYYGPGDGFERVYQIVLSGCRGLLESLRG